MALEKVTYVDNVTVITAAQMNAIQDAIITLEESGGGTSGGSDPSLGITGATVGQIAKITAVNSAGKPTAWEPVDIERDFELIATLDFSDEAMHEKYKTVSYTLDNASEIILIGSALFCENASSQSTLAVKINGTAVSGGYLPVTGKTNQGIYSYVIYRVIPGIGLFAVRTAGTTGASYQHATNGQIPYNLAQITGPITSFEIGQGMANLALSGTVKVYARG